MQVLISLTKWTLAILLTVFLLLTGIYWSAYVLNELWSWFVVPTFGLPILGIPVAAGLYLIALFLTAHKRGDEAVREMTGLHRFGILVSGIYIKPGCYLVLGYVIKGYL